MNKSDSFDRRSKLILCKFAKLEIIVSWLNKDLNDFYGVFTQ